MPPSQPKPPATELGDRAVEALFILGRDVRSAPSMRQLPLFEDVDDGWLTSARLGMVTVVLRAALVLHAEARGLLPLGDPAYDGVFALTPFAHRRACRGAWRRLLRLSQALAGGRDGLESWDSALFDATWLGAFANERTDGRESLGLSDKAIHEVLRVLVAVAGSADLEVEQVAALYERLIGFDLIRCRGRSIRWGNGRVVVDLDALAGVDPEARGAFLAELGVKPSSAVLRRVVAANSVEELVEAIRGRRRCVPMSVGTAVLQPSLARRRAGAHYTPPDVVQEVVKGALAPLLGPVVGDANGILSLRVCDPAMGTGAFLTEACRQLADAVVSAENGAENGPVDGLAVRQARWKVASACLYGVDIDPTAVELARLSLRFVAAGPHGSFPKVSQNLRQGDALLGIGPWTGPVGAREPDPRLRTLTWMPRARAVSRAHTAARLAGSRRPRPSVERMRQVADGCVQTFLGVRGPASRQAVPWEEAPMMVREPTVVGESFAPFHWPLEFPEVFAGPSGGFDAFVGNPPWVAFAGRAAQPLSTALRGYYLHVSDAFRGYRTLHGLFVHRCASLLRPGGRLGLVVPTSMSDLDGYVPVRRVHDALCEVDGSLPEFGGHAFEGVFQPAMALLSTRRSEPREGGDAGHWPVQRGDLEDWSLHLLDRMGRWPTVPAAAFAERGFQSTKEDAPRMRQTSVPSHPFTVPIREGADVRPFEALPPRLHLDGTGVQGRLRGVDDFARVGVLIRQTARYPIAALADGVAFRNSVLAGYGFEGWPVGALLAYLNAWPLRWVHYMRHRDARQGMPQVKISHLRSLPAPALCAEDAAALDALGRKLGVRNKGIDDFEQRDLDALVGRILGMCSNELDRIERWRKEKGFR